MDLLSSCQTLPHEPAQSLVGPSVGGSSQFSGISSLRLHTLVRDGSASGTAAPEPSREGILESTRPCESSIEDQLVEEVTRRRLHKKYGEQGKTRETMTEFIKWSDENPYDADGLTQESRRQSYTPLSSPIPLVDLNVNPLEPFSPQPRQRQFSIHDRHIIHLPGRQSPYSLTSVLHQFLKRSQSQDRTADGPKTPSSPTCRQSFDLSLAPYTNPGPFHVRRSSNSATLSSSVSRQHSPQRRGNDTSLSRPLSNTPSFQDTVPMESLPPSRFARRVSPPTNASVPVKRSSTFQDNPTARFIEPSPFELRPVSTLPLEKAVDDGVLAHRELLNRSRHESCERTFLTDKKQILDEGNILTRLRSRKHDDNNNDDDDDDQDDTADLYERRGAADGGIRKGCLMDFVE